MKVFVLGGTGMLGHKLAERFSSAFETTVSIRGNSDDVSDLPPFRDVRILGGLDAHRPDVIRDAMVEVKPHVVVNAIGVVKQDAMGADPRECAAINASLPNHLAKYAGEMGARLITLSTDCVFAGTKGGYDESAEPDATDVYGLSKRRGEIVHGNALTLRTSIIGRELTGTQGLVEWFLSKRNGSVKGYTKAIFSGFPTCVLADILVSVIRDNPELKGVYHLSSQPISKYELLKLIDRAFGTDTEIVPDESVSIDRSLDSARFRKETGFAPMQWDKMVELMYQDSLNYEEWRKR